jgi:hypothetical protein
MVQHLLLLLYKDDAQLWKININIEYHLVNIHGNYGRIFPFLMDIMVKKIDINQKKSFFKVSIQQKMHKINLILIYLINLITCLIINMI